MKGKDYEKAIKERGLKKVFVAEKMGISDPVIEFEGYRESDPERRLLSTTKIRTRTNWKPQVDLNKGLDECIKNYLAGN